MRAGGRITHPAEIGNVAKPPPIRLPDPTVVFLRRAARFAELASGNPIGDFLSFMGEVAGAQSAALDILPTQHPSLRRVLLDRGRWRPDRSWQRVLAVILDRLGHAAATGEIHSVIDCIARRDAGALDALAVNAVHFESARLEPGEACLAFAALQVYWTGMAGLIQLKDIEGSQSIGACPVCGSPPIASIVYSSGSLAGSRFLLCPLCATEWHLVRIKCANCDSTKGIAYFEIDGAGGLIKAETCDECGTYTKIIYTEKEPGADAFADDLGSLGLDVLVGEAGWHRATPNPFLLPGAG